MYAEWSSEGWYCGSLQSSSGESDWYARHEPTAKRWIEELVQAGDPYWSSAKHAAWCLVTNRIFEAESSGDEPRWHGFDVGQFLFDDLSEGGTVGLESPPVVFFDQLVEALRRFVADGLVEREPGEAWIARMLAARVDFVRCYDPETSSEEAMAISDRYRPDEPPPPPSRTTSAIPFGGPSRRERRAAAPKKRIRKRVRRR